MSASLTRLVAIVTVVVAVLAPIPAAHALGRQFDAFGLDAGGQPRVKVYLSAAFQIADFLAFAPGFTGGVRVAVGDIDGDGIDDVVVGAGPGGGPHVQVFKGTCSSGFDPTIDFCPGGLFGVDSTTPLASFFAFDPGFTGGVYVAVGNFDPSNDAGTGGPPADLPCRRNEIVVGAGGGGGPHVKIFKNATTGGNCPSGSPVVIDPSAPIVSFFPYGAAFAGGVRVAARDLNTDGFADLITGAGPGGGSHVQVFRNLSTGTTFGGLDTTTPVASFLAFPGFGGGVYVGTTFLGSTSPFTRPSLLVGAGPGGGPEVLVIQNTGSGTGFGFDLATPFAAFYALDVTFTGGVRVSSLAGDGILLLAPGPGGSGFVKAMEVFNGAVVDTMFGASPFDLSPLGLFPSQ